MPPFGGNIAKNCKFTAIYQTVIITFLLKKYCLKSALLKKLELLEIIEMPQTLFHNFLYSRKYDLIRLTPYHWQPCILQFCDIKKGIILQKFLLTKKCDFQLVTVSSLAITKSENLTIVTGTCRPRLPVLIYSRLRLL